VEDIALHPSRYTLYPLRRWPGSLTARRV